MAKYENLTFTDVGKDLSAKVLAGETKMEFTRLVVSSTRYDADDLKSLTSLSNIEQETSDLYVQILNSSEILVTTAVSNETLTRSYYAETVGLYAKAEGGTEILYAVCNETTGNNLMPQYDSKEISTLSFSLTIYVGDTANVTIKVTDAAYATVAELNARIAGLGKCINNISLNNSTGDVSSTNRDKETTTFLRKASATNFGIVKLYDNADGENTDGAVTQKAIKEVKETGIACVKNIAFTHDDSTIKDYMVLTYPNGDTEKVEMQHASATLYGIAKLYAESGTNTDGSMTQKAVTDAISSKASELQSNFQDGVDGIHDAMVAEGTTPASNSQGDVETAVHTLSANRYNDGVNSVTVSAAASGATVTATASNGKTASATVAMAGSNGVVSVSTGGGTGNEDFDITDGYCTKVKVDRTGAYNAGHSAVGVTMSTSGRTVTATLDNGKTASASVAYAGTNGAVSVSTSGGTGNQTFDIADGWTKSIIVNRTGAYNAGYSAGYSNGKNDFSISNCDILSDNVTTSRAYQVVVAVSSGITEDDSPEGTVSLPGGTIAGTKISRSGQARMQVTVAYRINVPAGTTIAYKMRNTGLGCIMGFY